MTKKSLGQVAEEAYGVEMVRLFDEGDALSVAARQAAWEAAAQAVKAEVMKHIDTGWHDAFID